MLGARLADGLKVTIAPLELTVPLTGAAPCKVTDACVMVAGFMASLKVMVITLSNATLVAPFAGSVDNTNGQIPSTCTKSSFLQLPKKAATENAAIAVVNNNLLFVFIEWVLSFDFFNPCKGASHLCRKPYIMFYLSYIIHTLKKCRFC